MSAFRLIRRGRKTLRRLYGGPLAIYIDRIAAWYDEQGYGHCYAVASLKSVDRFGRWLDRRSIALRNVNEQLIVRYVLLLSARAHAGTHVALRRLLTVLREDGASPPVFVDRGPAQRLEDEFKQYLVRERGLAERTVGHYTDAAHIFLAALFGQDRQTQVNGPPPTCSRSYGNTRKHADLSTCDSCAWDFGSFCATCGFAARPSEIWQVPSRGLHTGDSRPSRSLCRPRRSSVSLRTATVSSDVGRRNHAVLLLMVRLGLRASEVRSLTLEDIDWRNGHLTINGKGRGPEQMPLPRDVGNALAAYLANGRPPSTSRAVFVRLTPPHTQFPNTGAVTIDRHRGDAGGGHRRSV